MNLVREGFNKEDIIQYGNMFLLANGRFGYRGTLEEYRKEQMVNFTVLAFYDKYKDKWREPINLPNPFYFHVKGASVLEDKIISHKFDLDIESAILYRSTVFENYKIESRKFVSNSNKDLLVEEYKITSLKDQKIDLEYGLDTDISEINGPHFITKRVKKVNNSIVFNGTTNERKLISLVTNYRCSVSSKFVEHDDLHVFKVNKMVKEGEIITIRVFSFITKYVHTERLRVFSFDREISHHIEAFKSLTKDFKIKIYGDEEANFETQYSLYHLLILIDDTSYNSIPARGLSGQTYKGAIFWDTEMFMLPVLVFLDPQMARNTLIYRINTLNGARAKARELGYKGAFYAWESQENGIERCSKYNVSDPVTNEPIRTYFGEKQIHISGDVVFAFGRYIDFTGDESILKEGGYHVIDEVIKFYKSYAKKLDDGKYHFLDVIGPDEYHEGVNDNAFTNYLVREATKIAIKYHDYAKDLNKPLSLEELTEFKSNIYRPQSNENGVIEQFDGYFKLKEDTPENLKKKLKNEKEYLGGANGLATPTKVIKQADVIAMLIALNPSSKMQYLKNNYNYYLPFTEHGSSLSSSMYSIAAAKVDDIENAYKFFRKSSYIEFSKDQKMFAGGIYIGGTHPASNCGAILSLIFGMLGMNIIDDQINFEPHFPKNFEKIEFKFLFRGINYSASITKDGYELKGV